MRWVPLAVVVLGLSSCREVETFSPDSSGLSGYQLEGNVVTQSGFPLQGVEVQLFYQPGNLYVAQDTARIPVPDSTTAIDVAVVSYDGKFIRSFSVSPAYQTLPRNLWNEKDSSGADAKNGIYFIRVSFNHVFARQYEWLVDGHVTATTDDQGQFVIFPRSLPIGSIVDLYDSSGVYQETADIAADILVRARSQTSQRTGYVTLTRDQITRITIVM